MQLPNQFIFITHSAELISRYYSTGDVYFIDNDQSGENQAHQLSKLDGNHQELFRLISNNLGLLAIGKKIVFIEGKSSSIDRSTYYAIAQKYSPDAQIIPVGSVERLKTLHALDNEISNSIFGVDFYMIRDRDGLSDNDITQLESKGHLRCLRKRHLENYFLDSEILLKVAERFCLTQNKPELTLSYIENSMRKIAEENFNLILMKNVMDYLTMQQYFDIQSVKSPESHTSEEIKTKLIEKTQTSISKLSDRLSNESLTVIFTTIEKKLKDSLDNGHWEDIFHGKTIFEKSCSDILKKKPEKIREAYVQIALAEKPEIFQDIIDIFNDFKN